MRVYLIGLLIISWSISCSNSTKNLVKTPENRVEYDIVLEARNLIGSSYRYGGTDPKGFDCSGLVKYLYLKDGISLQGGSRHIYDQVDRVSAKDIKPVDLAFFTLNGKIDHVALVSKVAKDQCYIVHSTTSKGVIEQDYLQSPYWTKKFYRYGRVQANQ